MSEEKKEDTIETLETKAEETPTTDQKIESTEETCPGKTIFLRNKSVGALNVEWELWDGRVVKNTNTLALNFDKAGQYKVMLRATNPTTCKVTDIDEVSPHFIQI